MFNVAFNKKFLLFLNILSLFFFVLSHPVYSIDFQGEFYSARVKDISDRRYEPAVIELLDNAKDSIVLSMYILKPQEKGPVSFLVKDLEEALERGVSVEIYLNTRFTSQQAKRVASEASFELLREKGAKIYTVTSRYRLHDKLIIADERYVVEGSVNWTVSAIKSNFESAVLIDSPQLAKSKLLRLRCLPLKGEKVDKSIRPDRPKTLGVLSEDSVVILSKSLLDDKNLFPSMVTGHDSRCMDGYLLLLAEAQRWKAKEFFLSLEDMATDLKMSALWSDTTLRRQVIKVLKRLRDKYKLIEVNFHHGKDAWISLKELPGDTFRLKGNFFDPDFLSSKSQPAKFTLLIKALLVEEGKSIDSFTRKEICERFHIGEKTLRLGLKP